LFFTFEISLPIDLISAAFVFSYFNLAGFHLPRYIISCFPRGVEICATAFNSYFNQECFFRIRNGVCIEKKSQKIKRACWLSRKVIGATSVK